MKTHKKTKVFAASAIAVAAVVAAAHMAHAGITDQLGQMFNSTSATSYHDKSRNGVFFGSLSLRSPVKQINIVSFDPPRLSAGCGGLDLRGGSFSFINSQEIVATLRQVAANAEGLAFQAAIKLINPSLAALINEFQSLLQSMNNLAKNTCSLGHLIVDKGMGALEDAVGGEGAINNMRISALDDVTASLKKWNTNASNFMKTTAALNPKTGNVVAKAIVKSGATKDLGFLSGAGLFGESGEDNSSPNSFDNRVLMSLIGFEIKGIPCEGQNSAGQAGKESASAADPNAPPVQCTGSPTLTLESLQHGGGVSSMRPNEPLNLYWCNNPNGAVTSGTVIDPQICTSMRKDVWNFQGIESWVNLKMFGTTDASDVTSDSIVGAMNQGKSYNRSGSHQDFLNWTGLPVDSMLTRIQNGDQRLALARRMSRYVSGCVTARVGESLYKAANKISWGNDYPLSNDTKENIKTLRNDYMAKLAACDNDRTALDTAQGLVLQATLVPGTK